MNLETFYFMGLLNTDIPPAPVPVEVKSQNVHVHFADLSYEEQQRLVRLALDTLPTRLNPPVVTQGDVRPMGLED